MVAALADQADVDTWRQARQGVRAHESTAWDDEELLAALRQALRARQAVSPGFVEAGKGAFAWRTIDAELAQLTYDSLVDERERRR